MFARAESSTDAFVHYFFFSTPHVKHISTFESLCCISSFSLFWFSQFEPSILCGSSPADTTQQFFWTSPFSIRFSLEIGFACLFSFGDLESMTRPLTLTSNVTLISADYRNPLKLGVSRSADWRRCIQPNPNRFSCLLFSLIDSSALFLPSIRSQIGFLWVMNSRL